MPTSIIPSLLDAIRTQAATALPALLVLDGVGVTDDVGDYLMVGVDDPNANSSTAANSSQAIANMGSTRSRDETGTVNCAALSWNGDGGQKAARDAAYATVAAVETFLRADPSLGLQAGGYLVAQMGQNHSLTQDQGDFGAWALVVFGIDFRARL